MSQIKLDHSKFLKRKKKISESASIPLLIILGSVSDLDNVTLSTSLCTYLLGYEFPNTIMIFDEKLKVFTGKKKVEILSELPECETYTLNKDLSNMDEVVKIISQYPKLAILGDHKTELEARILKDLNTVDISDEFLKKMIIKDDEEIESCRNAGLVVSHIIKNGTESLKDGTLDHSSIEDMLCRDIGDLDNNSIEFCYPPEIDRNILRIGIRYNGYCAEGSRTVFADLNILYNAQKYILGLIKPGSSSKMIYNKCEEYFKNNDLVINRPFLYTIGLLNKEVSFEEDFNLQNGILFVVSLRDSTMILTNTFVLKDKPVYLTPEDKSEDFLDNRPRFRDKKKEHELDIRRKEHQKELLDKLIAEQLNYYRNKISQSKDQKEVSKTLTYAKESHVPRKGSVIVDYNAHAVVVPISEYSVPFHISLIKSAVVVNENTLKINFNAEKKAVADFNSEKLTLIKTINVTTGDAREIHDQIQDLKIKYSASSDKDLVKQDVLVEKMKKIGLEGIFVRTDIKTAARKKKPSNLELHENGLRFVEDKIDILFTNIRHVYFIKGDIQNKTILHFHLSSPILINNKKTRNIQFYQEAGTNLTYNTQKRGDEQMEYIIEKEEEDRQRRLNREFEVFASKLEEASSLKVQTPKDGFYGVHARESVLFQQTHDSIVSLFEQPFFVLSLEDVEIVNFERVVYNVKTADVVFIFKDKTLPPSKILSIETSYMGRLKDYLDSNNIVYMETVFNIQWKAVLNEILEDPISFYESGGWVELMVDDKPEDDVKTEDESEEVSSEEDEVETSAEESSDNTSYDESDDIGSDSSDSSEEDSEDDSSEEHEKRYKR